MSSRRIDCRRMGRDEDDPRTVPDAPPTLRRDAVIERIQFTVRVVMSRKLVVPPNSVLSSIDLHFTRMLEAVRSPRLQPIRVQRFDRVIRRLKTAVRDLLSRDQIPIRARLRRRPVIHTPVGRS